MSIQDRIDEIVELLREAELDDAVWPTASALIDDTCGLAGNDLLVLRLVGDKVSIPLRWLFLRGEPRPELQRDYAENYAAIDERIPAADRTSFGKLVHTNSLIPKGVRRRSETYNEYLVPNEGENCLNVRMRGGNSAIAWSLVGPGGGGPGDWKGDQVEAIQQLCPTCTTSYEFGKRCPRPARTVCGRRRC